MLKKSAGRNYRAEGISPTSYTHNHLLNQSCLSSNETAVFFAEISAKSSESVAKAAWITLVGLMSQLACLDGYVHTLLS